MRNFRDYKVWQDAKDLALKVYALTDSFDRSEAYGLTGQIRRSAVSISSNIAEGASRTSDKEFVRFLEIALGSAFELESQVSICRELAYISNEEYTTLLNGLHSIKNN